MFKNFLGKVFSQTGKNIMVSGVLIPALGAFVGVVVQTITRNAISKNEKKKLEEVSEEYVEVVEE